MFIFIDVLLLVPVLAVVLLSPAMGFYSSLRFWPALLLTAGLMMVGTGLCCALAHHLVDVKLWWPGVDFDGFTFAEQLRDVHPGYRTKAQALINSRMGIPWPLAAMMLIVVVVLPYTLVSFSVVRCVRNRRAKNTA